MNNYKDLTENGLRALMVEVVASGVKKGEIDVHNADDMVVMLGAVFGSLVTLTTNNVAVLNVSGEAIVKNADAMTMFPKYEE